MRMGVYMHEKLERWINWIQYDELMNGENNSPHKLLGIHPFDKGQVINAYRPNAQKITVVSKDGDKEDDLEMIGENGFFGIYLERPKYNKYFFRIQYAPNDIVEVEDAYSFSPYITDVDRYLFGEGKHYMIYEKLGAHPMTLDGVKGTYFAVWAPNARSVSVVGSFNMWDGRLHPMRQLEISGIYELFIPRVDSGAIYKYQILTRDKEVLLKSDPYAYESELRPNNASIVCHISDYKWNDNKWLQKRCNEISYLKKPMNIYEVHLGSWRKKENNTEDGFYNYREIAHLLADYMIEMGYTHLELMGIAEHPYDGSWGYQVTGYYAPTKRYGTAEDFMYFVDYMHQKGIYVILDWVPAHFPKDAHGLGRFDGSPLYEHPDRRRGEHPHWGTYIFNYGRKEVENFIIANALFWIEKYHIDGLRVDAVASMLYLDYGKENGQWLPNKYGGKENLDVIQLFRHMNRIVEERNPGTFIIAEESTSWPLVTAPAKDNGLAFAFKWNMGWMNDFLEYMKLDPYFRKYSHNKLIFSIEYAYSEHFIQVLSHDEVVHGKGSMIEKMPGEDEDKYANLRTAYAFMYGHPGKKLLFMGQEFAQRQEWSEARSLDWGLLGEEMHAKMQSFIKTLNNLYKSYSAFYANDCDSIGFEWINCTDANNSIVSFIRRGESVKDQLLFVCNFTPIGKEKFRVGVPCEGLYTQILNTDNTEFGGGGRFNEKVLNSKYETWDNQEYLLEFYLPPLSTIIFKFDYIAKTKTQISHTKL